MTVATVTKPDFSGWATKAGLKCSDGRTIMTDAFKHQDQTKVPLIWSHDHDNPENILGYAILEHREEGVRVNAFFNDSERAKAMRAAVEHGDVESLSIHANRLREDRDKNVFHGMIKEVSLVLAGANPGAMIDNVYLRHGDDVALIPDELYIYPDLPLDHGDVEEDGEDLEHAEDEKTIAEVIDTLNPEQKKAVNFVISQLAKGDDDDDDAGDGDAGDGSASHSDEDGEDADNADNSADNDDESNGSADESNNDDSESSDEQIQHSQEGTHMTRNAWAEAAKKKIAEGVRPSAPRLTHSELVSIVEDAKKRGSYKEAFSDFIEHADYGIENIEYFFPEARNLTETPELLARQTEWVTKVLGATKHSPFAKIRSIVADLTAEEARAKGYVKGTKKMEEVFGLLKRTTGPTTVYKKQKLDRDDIIDITDFDVIAWLKWEIRFMLNEEIARAILVGDGRSNSNPDKIKDPAGAADGIGIRSIANDDELYAHKVQFAANVSATEIIDGVTRARTHYRGSGSPSMYTTDKILVELLLLKDKMGRRLYATEAELASAMRVKEIVAVEVMEETPTLLAIVVNLIDYTVGANKGGEINFFEDFDIDFNQEKYLMETRISGALTKPKSALVIRRDLGELVTPTAPSFNGTTEVITIPATPGVEYLINDLVVEEGDQPAITEATEVRAEPETGYYIPAGTTTSWVFTP